MAIPTTQTGYCYDNETHKLVKVPDLPVKQPSRGEVLVKIEGAGLCNSDLHVLSPRGGPIDVDGSNDKSRFVMGHEIAGRIVAVGPGTETTFKEGDRVACFITHACGECIDCRLGRDNICGAKAYGLNQDGGFQEYLLVDKLRTLLPIPDNVSYEQACSACDAILTPFHAIQKVRDVLTNPTTKVLVVGVGGLGMNAVQILRNYPVDITAVDLKPELKERALGFGASRFGTSLDQITDDDEEFEPMFNLVFDFIGNQALYDSYYMLLQRRAKVMMVGLAKPTFTIHNFLNAMRETEIIFSFGGNSQEQIQVLEWISLGRVKPITSNAPLDDLPKYLQLLKEGKIVGRVVFQPKL